MFLFRFRDRVLDALDAACEVVREFLVGFAVGLVTLLILPGLIRGSMAALFIIAVSRAAS